MTNFIVSDGTASNAKAVKFGMKSSGGTVGNPVMFWLTIFTRSASACNPAGETPTQQVSRLVSDYGTFSDSKVYYGGSGCSLPLAYNSSAGEGLTPAN